MTLPGYSASQLVSHWMQPSSAAVPSRMHVFGKKGVGGSRDGSLVIWRVHLPHTLPISKHRIWRPVCLSGRNNCKRPQRSLRNKSGKQENTSVVKQEHKAARTERAKTRRREVCGLVLLCLSAPDLPCAFNSVTHKESSNVWLFDSMAYRNAFPLGCVSQPGMILSPRGHSMKSGDNFGCQNEGAAEDGIWCAETRDVAKYPTRSEAQLPPERIIWSSISIGPWLRNLPLEEKLRTSVEFLV